MAKKHRENILQRTISSNGKRYSNSRYTTSRHKKLQDAVNKHRAPGSSLNGISMDEQSTVDTSKQAGNNLPVSEHFEIAQNTHMSYLPPAPIPDTEHPPTANLSAETDEERDLSFEDLELKISAEPDTEEQSQVNSQTQSGRESQQDGNLCAHMSSLPPAPIPDTEHPSTANLSAETEEERDLNFEDLDLKISSESDTEEQSQVNSQTQLGRESQQNCDLCLQEKEAKVRDQVFQGSVQPSKRSGVLPVDQYILSTVANLTKS